MTATQPTKLNFLIWFSNLATLKSQVSTVCHQHCLPEYFHAKCENPIIIDQKYCPSQGCPNQDSGVKISGVTYKNIRGTSATKVAMSFVCSASNPCRGLKLQNIILTYNNTSTATSYCSHAGGSTSVVVLPRSCF